MASKAAASGQLATMSAKKYVTGGHQLWVSSLLHEKGAVSTNRIWEEFLRDQGTPRALIPSKSFLKHRVLSLMEQQGKISKERALDMPQFKRAGWKVHPTKAFKAVAPAIIMQLDPIPQLDRQDVREYIEKQFQLFEEALEDDDSSVAEAMKQAEEKHM